MSDTDIEAVFVLSLQGCLGEWRFTLLFAPLLGEDLEGDSIVLQLSLGFYLDVW